MHKFVKNIIGFSLKNHVFILFLTGLSVIIGIVCYINTPIEAYPDVTNTQVHIITQWPGRSAEEVEKFISLPIMREMNTIPRKSEVRSISLFGLSVINIIFEDDVDDFYAQQYASNRMQGLDLPEGSEPFIEPPSGATGEIYRYIFKSDLPIREISAINEWVVKRELLAVPGVADILTFGGEEKIYEIRVNPAELLSYNLSPLEVFEAVSNSNINVGGDMIQKGSQAYVVRGLGLLESIEDIENILIDVRGSLPIRVKEVATVAISAKPRLGQSGLNYEDDVVQGIVIMLKGQNPSEVINRLKDKVAELNDRILPEDVRIEPFMDRTKLVNTTIRTVLKNMLIGILLVSCVVFLFLYNWRVSVIVASVIPLAFLFAIIMLRIQGLPANLISMGALDFGLLLEGTLVIAEVIFVALLHKSKELGGNFKQYSKSGLIKNSAGSVGSYILFAQLTSIAALIPIFAFQKVEGKMFSPLAFTLGYALIGSLILSLTYVPVMCKLMLTKKPLKDKSNLITRALTNWTTSLYNLSCRYRLTTIVVFLVVFGGCLLRFMFWGTEFIPSMNEGAVYIRATLPNSVNLDESVRITKEMKAKLQKFDEVDFILTQTGRPNDGTDATGFFNIEFHVELKPKKEWRRKVSKDELINQIDDSLSIYPGIVLAFSQPIQDNVEEYVSGVKSALVIKIFGNNLHELEAAADKVAGTIKDVRGIEDVNVFRSIGLPELQIRPQEVKMAQYAVSMADAQAVIEMAIGGKAATTFYENERTFDVMLRFEQQFRSDEQKIGDMLIPTMDGKQVPLKEIADIEFVTGPAFIYREGSSRYVGVGFSVRDRDLGSAIREAQSLVETDNYPSLPPNLKIEWAGEFESQQRATQRLSIVVPAVLLLLLFFFYMNFGTVKDTLIAASAFPYAFIGGFISLWISGIPFGISAGIGFVILFGIIATNSILLTSTMKTLLQQSRNIEFAINETVRIRLRALLMITLMGSVGLLPAAISTGMGSEIQKPLAIMIVGGILFCLVLSITVLPQVFYYTYKSEPRFSKD